MISLFNIKIITKKDDFNFNVEIFVSRNKIPNFLALGHMALFFFNFFFYIYIFILRIWHILYRPKLSNKRTLPPPKSTTKFWLEKID